jgi:glyoxylase-like metal-dependent hydrolase (beta-lactamase superfamily II)
VQRPLQIANGIDGYATRTPTLPPATHTNSYALGDRDILLVEPSSPYEDEQREFIAWAKNLEGSGRRLVAFFLTHHHPDHVGGAELYARELGLPLWAHRLTAERLPRAKVSRILEDGEDLLLAGQSPQRWRVLHTPGHAQGHLCLHEPELGYLIAGDMVASEGTILIEPGDGDMETYLNQLERLRGLGARVVLPAHGAPIHDTEGVFERYIRHRKMREAKIVGVLETFGEEGAELTELVARAYDDTPRALWVLAGLSVRAHLVKLIREGRVDERGDRYSAPSVKRP